MSLVPCGVPCGQDGVYVNTRGPRYETKAEVKHFATIGDVVGMTAAHEAGLAKELGLKYAAVCVVDNVCNGLQGADGALWCRVVG